MMTPDRSPDRRASRRRWLLAGGLLAVCSIGYGVLTLVQLLAHDETVRRSSHDASALTALVVDHDHGSVRVLGADVDRVSVTAEVSRGLTATDQWIEEIDGELVIHDNCPPFQSFWCAVDYEITVPRDLPLRIESDDGRVTVGHMAANVSVATGNGTQELEAITGALRLESRNGRIVGRVLDAPTIVAETRNGSIELDVVEAPSSLIARSRNGHIQLEVPDIGDGYAVSAASNNGRVEVDVIDNPRSPRVISASTRNGSITILPPDPVSR